MRNVALSMMLPLIVQLQTARPILKESRHNNYFRRNDFHDCLSRGEASPRLSCFGMELGNIRIEASQGFEISSISIFDEEIVRPSVRQSVRPSTRPPVRPFVHSSVGPSVCSSEESTRWLRHWQILIQQHKTILQYADNAFPQE